MSSSASTSDTKKSVHNEQIHVKGSFGTRTVRIDDEPDYGVGDVYGVVSFDGVVDWRDDSIVGVVSFGSDVLLEKFTDSIRGRVESYEVHLFDSDTGGK